MTNAAPLSNKMIIALAAAMIAGLTLTASARTMNMTANQVYDPAIMSFDFTFDNVGEGTTNKLFMVCGTSDEGSTFSGWDSIRFVADVPGDTTSITGVRPPADWGTGATCLRFFLTSGGTVPDAVQLDSIEATQTGGNQYILTSFTANGASKVEADLKFATIDEGQCVFCSRAGANASNYFVLIWQSTQKWRWDYNNQKLSSSETGTMDTERHTLRADSSGLKIDGTLVNGTKPTAATFTAGGPMSIFAAHTGGNPVAGWASYGKFKLYSFKAWADKSDDSTIALDLVPCMKSDGTVCLYNKVDGTFLTNNGTGSFTAGEVSETIDSVSTPVTFWSQSATPFTAHGVAFNGGRLQIVVSAGTAGTCQMDGDCTIGSIPLTLALVAEDDIYGISEVKMMTVPTSVKVVTADDFAFDGTSLPLELPRFYIDIRDEGGDVQGVYLVRRNPVVFRDNTDIDATNSGTTFDAAVWSDGDKVTAGNDYAITNGASIRTTTTFVGESLTLGDGATLLLKQVVQTIGDLVAFPDATIINGKSTGSAELRGNLRVCGTWADPVFIGDSGNNGTILASKLSGDGVLKFGRSQGSDLKTSVTNDNSEFTGSMEVVSGSNGSMTFTVGSATSLGGDLASYNYRALKIGSNVTLVPSKTMTLSAANRGILVAGDAKIDVPDGITLTVAEPIAYNGSLTKIGAGTLVLSGDACFENAGGDGVTAEPTVGKNILVLSNGVVEATSASSLSNLVVKAGEGTLSLNMALGERGVECVGFDVSESGLKVVAAMQQGRQDVCLFTVPETDAAVLVGNVSAFGVSGGRRSRLKVKEVSNGDGTVSFCGHKLGLMIVFQ